MTSRTTFESKCWRQLVGSADKKLKGQITLKLKIKARAEEDIAFGREYYQEIGPQFAIYHCLEVDTCFELIFSNTKSVPEGMTRLDKLHSASHGCDRVLRPRQLFRDSHSRIPFWI